jgi:hypothetical protein
MCKPILVDTWHILLFAQLSDRNLYHFLIVYYFIQYSFMKLYIKYMVSIRCKMAVKAVLDSMGLHYRSVEWEK